MRKRKVPFLKCCEWLYLGALSTGILFVVQGFLQNELAQVTVFPEAAGLFVLIAVFAFAVQLLFVWSGEKGYRIQIVTGLLAVNGAAWLFCMKQENQTAFWCYAGLEAACIAAAAVVYVVRHFSVLKGVLVLAQTVSLVVLAILKKPFPGWCVCVMLTAFLLFLAELTAQERKEVVGLLPLFAAAQLLLYQIPQNENPFDWSGVKDAYASIQEKAEILMVNIAYQLEGENAFSFAFEGYGNDSGLGGFVLDGSQAQLHITGSDTKNPLYLTGAVYGTYTGTGWQAVPPQPGETALPQGKDGILNALKQSIYADEQEKLTSSALISVEYGYIKTRDFFHELHTTDLYFYGAKPQFEKDALWKMKDAGEKDFTYQFRFLELNEKSDEIKALFRGQAWKEDAVWDSALAERENEIYEIYTELPDTIPKRVYELAHTIAADADNTYDRMAAFADYLKDYEYTKMPPACPDGQEFIDYFLFDSKSGYCTYFATAMAVLGRCEGIPTRYIQGFMTTDTCQNTSSDVTITGKNAHAWTEVYIEHIGWVRFDATPGYGEAPTDKWVVSDAKLKESAESPYPIENMPQEEALPETEEQSRDAGAYALAAVEMIVLLLTGFILAAIIAVCFRNMLHRKKYARMDMEEQVRYQIKRLLQLGRLQGVTLAEGETLQAYQKRAQIIPKTDGYSFERACDLYESIRFGAKSVSSEELQKLEEYAEAVERYYLAGCGFLRKLVYWIL